MEDKNGSVAKLLEHVIRNSRVPARMVRNTSQLRGLTKN